eukprot:m.72949 g.72949  ORF g.72949 m.72949 type:complete len:139 (-) comp12371_c0_seq2:242-658(-)
MKLPPNLEGFQNEDPVRFLELVTRALMGQSEYNTQLDLQERQDDENENETRTNNSNATDPRTELQRMLDEELELSLLYDEDEAILEYEREQSVRSETTDDLYSIYNDTAEWKNEVVEILKLLNLKEGGERRINLIFTQ